MFTIVCTARTACSLQSFKFQESLACSPQYPVLIKKNRGNFANLFLPRKASPSSSPWDTMKTPRRRKKPEDLSRPATDLERMEDRRRSRITKIPGTEGSEASCGSNPRTYYKAVLIGVFTPGDTTGPLRRCESRGAPHLRIRFPIVRGSNPRNKKGIRWRFTPGDTPGPLRRCESRGAPPCGFGFHSSVVRIRATKKGIRWRFSVI